MRKPNSGNPGTFVNIAKGTGGQEVSSCIIRMDIRNAGASSDSYLESE